MTSDPDLGPALCDAIYKLTIEVKRIADTFEQLLISQNFRRANELPTTKPPAQAPTQPMPQMDWKPFKDKPGHWIFSKTNQLLKDQLLQAPNKTLERDGFKYRLSGENDMFIQRFAAGGAKM